MRESDHQTRREPDGINFLTGKIKTDAGMEPAPVIVTLSAAAEQEEAAQSGCAVRAAAVLARKVFDIAACSFLKDGRSIAHIFMRCKGENIRTAQDRLN